MLSLIMDVVRNQIAMENSHMRSPQKPSVENDQSTRRILIIDDDVELCELIGEFLEPENFLVESVHSGTKGLELALNQDFDLIVLDVMLPGTRGFEVLQRLRVSSRVPVIMLTARGQDVDRILGLEIGADDYLPKPFNPRELAARIHAVLRRAAPQATVPVSSSAVEHVRLGDIDFDAGSRTVLRSKAEIDLTSAEFDLLSVFLHSAGVVIDREDLARQVLGRDLAPFDRSIDVHVSNLRRKLGPLPDGKERIKAIRSVGYLYSLSEHGRKK
jgi:two-component system, OmpR family, response regulator CpxR